MQSSFVLHSFKHVPGEIFYPSAVKSHKLTNSCHNIVTLVHSVHSYIRICRPTSTTLGINLHLLYGIKGGTRNGEWEIWKRGNAEMQKCGYLGARGPESVLCRGNCRQSSTGIMATAPELIDLTMSSPGSSSVDSDAGSESDESVIVTEVIRYVDNDKTMLVWFITFSLCLQSRWPKNEVRELLA